MSKRRSVKGGEGDLRVEGGGTVYLVRPLTRRGDRWITENIDREAVWFGGAVAVEHRYIGEIILGAYRDGLKVSTALAELVA